ncbi:hypothetical protein ES705_10136 [subsurface metagenome]
MTKHENMKPLLDFDSLPVRKTEKATRFSLDKGIDNMVGSLYDPIIVHQCSWATPDMIPEWLRNQITLDRMIELMVANKEGRDPIGTDSEALAYMIPASMEAPMGHDWTQIYLYLATVVIDRDKNKTVPDDIRVDKLDKMQQEDLLRLKRWLYETKLKHRRGRRKEIKQEIKEEEEKEKAALEVTQHAFNLD